MATRWDIKIGKLGSQWNVVKDGIDISSQIDKITIRGVADDISYVEVRFIDVQLNIKGDTA